MKKALTALLLAFTLATSAVAQTPSDESLIKFLQLSEMDKAFETGLYASLDFQKQLFENQIAQKQGITSHLSKSAKSVLFLKNTIAKWQNRF